MRISILAGITMTMLLLALPAAASDYTLSIFGNANEDATINMQDVTYTELIILEYRDRTELADGKHDGKINMQDVTQIELVILGKEKELTIGIPATWLQAEQVITVQKPVERIVVLMPSEAEVLRSINAADMIVGVGKHIRDDEIFFHDLGKLPLIGTWMGTAGLDYEAILNLNPDIFLAFVRGPSRVDEEKLPGVTVIGLLLHHPEGFTERVRLLGYILDKEEETEEYINWHEGWINEIKSRTEGLTEDEKQRVFCWGHFRPEGTYTSVGKGNRIHEICDIAGGINIAADLAGTWPKVDPEWLIEQNPDIIVAQTSASNVRCGYDVDDPSEMVSAREDILNRPELAEVTAVKNGRVCILGLISSRGSAGLPMAGYMAKWFYPELFAELDPQAIHQEYLTDFQGLDYDLSEHGVFAYPPPEVS